MIVRTVSGAECDDSQILVSHASGQRGVVVRVARKNQTGDEISARLSFESARALGFALLDVTGGRENS